MVIPLVGCNKTNGNKVTVAEVTHSLFYAPQYVAMSQGFFEEEGLEIDLVNAQGGRFEIDIDGDLFKAKVVMNEYNPSISIEK